MDHVEGKIILVTYIYREFCSDNAPTHRCQSCFFSSLQLTLQFNKGRFIYMTETGRMR